MQEIFVVTPVVAPHRLAAMYKSMESSVPDVLLHWFVVFDLAHVKEYTAWKAIFSYGQVDGVNVHCILSDRHQPSDKHHYNRNIALDILEAHVLQDHPGKKDCWVYQLEDSNELHPAFQDFFHRNIARLQPYRMVVFNDVMPADLQAGIHGHSTYAVRLKTIQGLRYHDRRRDFLSRLVNRNINSIYFSEQKVYEYAKIIIHE